MCCGPKSPLSGHSPLLTLSPPSCAPVDLGIPEGHSPRPPEGHTCTGNGETFPPTSHLAPGKNTTPFARHAKWDDTGVDEFLFDETWTAYACPDGTELVKLSDTARGTKPVYVAADPAVEDHITVQPDSDLRADRCDTLSIQSAALGAWGYSDIGNVSTTDDDLLADSPTDATFEASHGTAVISPEVVQAVFDFCRILRADATAPPDPLASQHNICIVRQVARAVGDHDAFFIDCIEERLGNTEGFTDLAQQMYALEHALARASTVPRRSLAACRAKSYKKRHSLLRNDFGTLFAKQTLQILAEEPAAIFAALVALREAAASLLLGHETLFYGCTVG